MTLAGASEEPSIVDVVDEAVCVISTETARLIIGSRRHDHITPILR